MESAIQSDSADVRKHALQRLCAQLRKGGVLEAPMAMKALVINCLVDPDSKVKRWAFNALAQMGLADDVPLMQGPWLQNRDDTEVFSAGLTALAHILGRDDLLPILKKNDVELEPGVVMAIGQQSNNFLDELNKIRLDVNKASCLELNQATLLIGLDKAPQTLFSDRYPVGSVIGELNRHPDNLIAQYSFWATVENPELSLKNLSVRPEDFSSLPPNVQGWAYRLITKANQIKPEHIDLVADASRSGYTAVREGMAIGLKGVFSTEIVNNVLDWILVETSSDIKFALLEHMAAFSNQDHEYREEVLRAYRSSGPSSILRLRMEAAAANDNELSLEFRRISLQTNDPDLFNSLVTPAMNNSQHFHGPVNAGGISNSGTGNHGNVNIKSDQEALEIVLPLLNELISKLAEFKSESASEGLELAKAAVSEPTKGRVRQLVDWLTIAKDGGEAASALAGLAHSVYDKLGPVLERLPDMIS